MLDFKELNDNFKRHANFKSIEKCLYEIDGVEYVKIETLDNFCIAVNVVGGKDDEIFKTLALTKPLGIHLIGEHCREVELFNSKIKVCFSRKED